MTASSSLTNRFERFYLKYKDAVYRHIFFRVYRQEIAEELTAQAFMKFWEVVSAGRGVKNSRAYLYQIANNLIIDRSRSKRDKDVSLEEALEYNPSLEPVLKDNLARNLERQELISLIKLLPKLYQKAIYYRYFKDMAPKEIAVVLNKSANNVSVLLTRAVKRLAEISKLKERKFHGRNHKAKNPVRGASRRTE